jgi:hypothetical protein
MATSNHSNILEPIKKQASKYAETILLSIFSAALVAFLTKKDFVIAVISIAYIIFLLAYAVWSFIEYKTDKKPWGTRMFLHFFCPVTLGIAIFIIFISITRYNRPDQEITLINLWSSGVAFPFVVLCIVFSIMGAVAYRIIRIKTNKTNEQVVYAATCIPIQKTIDRDDEITFFLIKNKSHTSNPWMFPGGHINIENNFINSHEEKYVKTIRHLPENVIIDKCRNEANIDIDFIDLIHNRCVNKDSLFHSDECEQAIAPVFNMKFQVSEYAECYKKFGHRVHYDFTYIAKYKKSGDEEANYKNMEVSFRLSDYSFDISSESDEIAKIGSKIFSTIGSGDRYKLFFSSIPTLIHETLKLFKKDIARLKLLN